MLKKTILSLMTCATFFAASPAFCMEAEDKKPGKHLTRTVKTSAEYRLSSLPDDLLKILFHFCNQEDCYSLAQVSKHFNKALSFCSLNVGIYDYHLPSSLSNFCFSLYCDADNQPFLVRPLQSGINNIVCSEQANKFYLKLTDPQGNQSSTFGGRLITAEGAAPNPFALFYPTSESDCMKRGSKPNFEIRCFICADVSIKNLTCSFSLAELIDPTIFIKKKQQFLEIQDSALQKEIKEQTSKVVGMYQKGVSAQRIDDYISDVCSDYLEDVQAALAKYKTTETREAGFKRLFPQIERALDAGKDKGTLAQELQLPVDLIDEILKTGRANK